MTAVSDPGRDHATFSAGLTVRGCRVGFTFTGRPASAWYAVMALCTLTVALEILAGAAWLITWAA